MSQNPLPAPRGDAQRGAADHHDRVSAMFDAIAGRYDLMNAVMTWGQEPRLVRHTVARANIPAQARVLDLATGTGDLAFEVLRQHARDHNLKMAELSRAVVRRDVAPQYLRARR